MNHRKVVFTITILALFACLCSCLACHHGHSGSFADPDAVLGSADPAPPESAGNADDGSAPSSDDEASECPAAVCAP